MFEMINKNTIKSAINQLPNDNIAIIDDADYTIDDELNFVKAYLLDCLNSIDSFEDLDIFETYVYSDRDPLRRNTTEQLSKDELFVEKVRDIQSDIISLFECSHEL
jgi:hypothetical protein